MLLAGTVDRCPRGAFACASFVSGRRCACAASGVSRSAFPARATATMSAAATSAAATPLATLTTIAALRTIAGNLTLLSGGLDAGPRFTACCGRGSARRRLCRTRVDVPIPLRAPVLVVFASIAIAAITSILTIPTITPVATASVGAPAIPVTAALTAL